MIKLTRFGGNSFVLNCEMIETIEATPDTIITMSDGKKLVVKETVEEVVEKVIEYKRRFHSFAD